MFCITVVCGGLTEEEGSGAVTDVLEEFSHRPWHQQVECTWAEATLSLSASNDYDRTGQALLEEFGDAISACLNPAGPIRSKVAAVVVQ